MALTTPFKLSILFWEGGAKKFTTPHLSPPPAADRVRLFTFSPATAPIKKSNNKHIVEFSKKKHILLLKIFLLILFLNFLYQKLVRMRWVDKEG